MEIEEEGRTKLIPLDITIEILLRLPAKSVGRFRSVSKLWFSITTTPHFIKSFVVHSSARPSLLLVKRKEDKTLFFSLPHRKDPQRRLTRVEKFEMVLPGKDNPKWGKGKVFSSIRGLICFEDCDQVVIWNPTLRQHVVLPDPKLSRPLVTFLGYDPVDDQYKVLCMSGCHINAPRENPRVLTLGAQESWRMTGPSTPGLPSRSVFGGICLKGILYYYKNDYNIFESFDVRSAKFQEIRQPKDKFGEAVGGRHIIITSYQGKLALYSTTVRQVWVLRDPQRQEWSQGLYYPDFSDPPQIMKSPTRGILGGVTDSEEHICIQEPTARPFSVCYHDAKKDEPRWVTYEGFAGCGIHCDRIPNHIENLMSLKIKPFSF